MIFRRKRQIENQRETIVQLRQLCLAQATALNELSADVNAWRQLALNTADVFTAINKANEA